MKLGEKNLRVALMMALLGLIKATTDDERDDLMADLVDRYDDDGTKSFDVKLPADEGGERLKVATVSLATTSESFEVIDSEALVEWAKSNAPSLLKVDIIPAVPAHWVEATPEQRIEVIDPKRLTEALAGFKGGPAGSVFDTETGGLVEGMAHKPGGQPKSFSVRFTPDGKADLARAWQQGRLADVLDGTPLPMLGGPA